MSHSHEVGNLEDFVDLLELLGLRLKFTRHVLVVGSRELEVLVLKRVLFLHEFMKRKVVLDSPHRDRIVPHNNLGKLKRHDRSITL